MKTVELNYSTRMDYEGISTTRGDVIRALMSVGCSVRDAVAFLQDYERTHCSRFEAESVQEMERRTR